MTAIKDFSLAAYNSGLTVSYSANYWSTLRDFWAAAATLDYTGYANQPIGTLRLTGAGNADRFIEQWNGTASVPFKFGSQAGFKADLFDSTFANQYIQHIAGSIFLNVGANRALVLDSNNKSLGFFVDGITRYSVDPFRLQTLRSRADEPFAISTIVATAASASQAANSQFEMQNELGFRKATYETELNTNGNTRHVIRLTPDGTARNTESLPVALLIEPGNAAGKSRVIVGGIPDDGHHAIQAKTARFTEQPFFQHSRSADLVVQYNAPSAPITFSNSTPIFSQGFSRASNTAAETTVLAAGVYKVTAHCQVGVSSPHVTVLAAIQLRKNGAFVFFAPHYSKFVIADVYGNYQEQLSMCYLINCEVGDYLSCDLSLLSFPTPISITGSQFVISIEKVA